MEKEGKVRIRRKDPQSRDFKCLCGKTYLSYAAAYTHAKNKHNGDREYLEGISKPIREQLKRGRPKQKKVALPNNDTARLNLIESTILKICELIEGIFPKTVLQGNEERSQSEYEEEIRALEDKFASQLPNIDSQNPENQGFLKALIKDFHGVVAARVKIAIQLLGSGRGTTENLVSKLERWDIWEGKSGINATIADALKEWKQLNQHLPESESEHAGHLFDIDHAD